MENHPRRLPQLDALRTVAIGLVLGRHFDPVPSAVHPIGRAFFLGWQNCGWIGVDLFFVLSGYLISGLLFQEYQQRNGVDIKRFLIRRGLKIYPAFLALFAFTCVFRIRTHAFVWTEMFAEILFVQNYFHGQMLHTWSLAVEEHFYLAAALAVALLVRLGNAKPFELIPIAFAIIAGLCLILRLLTSQLHPQYDFYLHLSPTHLRADALMFGVFLSYLDHFHRAIFRSVLFRYRLAIGLVSAVLISPAFFLIPEQPFMRTIGLTLVYLGCGGWLMLAINSEWAGKSRLISIIGRIGFYSYSIYLWHIVWRHFAFAEIPFSHFIELLFFYFGGSVCVGILMAKLIEVPMLMLRDRLFPSDLLPAHSQYRDEKA